MVDINQVSLRKKSIVGKSLCCMQRGEVGGVFFYDVTYTHCYESDVFHEVQT